MRRPIIALAALSLCMTALPFGATGVAPTFYADDPLDREPDSQDASKVQAWDIDLAADLLINLFGQPGDPARGVRARNVNTIDEVPDSSWFTNRIYSRGVSLDELRRGPNTLDGPAPGRWAVIRPKTTGFAPGFVVRDEKGEVWFLSFDAKGYARAATGAIAVASKLFWALGYHQVESYISNVRRENIAVANTARIRTRSGRVRRMTMEDVERVLRRAEPNSDGSYRVLAGREVPGRTVGGFRYYGTRPDDPNDVVPHEHRRELRALKVFGAWTNLVDLKAGNTLDTLVTENGRGVVRHYLQDVGSTFGTGALAPREWDEGYEYLYEGGPTWKRLVSLGFYVRPWQVVPYEEAAEVGRFEGDAFDPERWRSRIPAAALLRARDDDTFWAALRVAAFTDEHIRAAVHAGEYADPAAERHLGDVLIKRRDKIARAYLPKITPLVRFALDADGTLTFENAAVGAGGAAPPKGGYRAAWAHFDNATAQTKPIGETTDFHGGSAPGGSRPQTGRAPAGLPSADGSFIKVSVSAVDPEHAPWTRAVDAYFKRTGGTWTLVGLERPN
jgi:hypothetical protein